MELLALQHGLFHVRELDALAIQIEGDYLALVTNVQNSATVAWDLMPTWQRTMDLLAKLDIWTIHHCKRTANRVADLLAKFDLSDVLEERAFLPPYIRAALAEDQTRAENYTRTFFHLPTKATSIFYKPVL